jgi:hypothetical protein
MRTLLRLATVTAVFLGVTFVHLPVSQAMEVPETLADRRPVGVGIVVPEFSVDYLGVLWETRGAAAEHAEEETEEHGAVRFRVDGAWTPWQPLTEDGAHAEGQWASALVPAGDAEAYQVRGVPADAVAPRAVALNTTDGPLVEVGRRPAGGAEAVDNCLSRKEWGADESLRFDSEGNEIWPTEFYDVQTMTVHHTATKNDDPDPDATVRAIYRYHAIDREWGDIGYHYLIDEQGQVYEGRWSGEASAACAGGPGGTDFAHDDAGDLVTAGHTGGYNSGNMGAALLGDFTTHPRNGAEPAGPAVDALENLLAEFATRHDLNPHAVVEYVNPADPTATNTVDMISGHRDWVSTECPGERLYDDLPAIRDAVAAQMGTLAVSVTSPAEGDTVSGVVPVAAAASDTVTSVEFTVDGASIGTDNSGSDGWTADWDTTALADGTGHTVTATATDGASTFSSSVSVTVDNDAAPVVEVTAPSDGATVIGSIVLAAGASDDKGVVAVDFLLDGAPLGSDDDGTDGWSVPWDTTSAPEGTHRLAATATDTAGQQATHSVTVTVDNVSVTGVDPASGAQNSTVTVTISGTGFAAGATVDLQNGEGTEPQVSNVQVVDSTTITATLTIGKTSGPRRDRPWDVAVINPDGTSAVRLDGFTVLR